MYISPAYQEIVDFIAAGTTPQNLIDFCPSEKAKGASRRSHPPRKTTELTPEETAELNHCLQLEHLMRLAKSRARYHLKNE